MDGPFACNLAYSSLLASAGVHREAHLHRPGAKTCTKTCTTLFQILQKPGKSSVGLLGFEPRTKGL
jgi:hypothetical protein